MNNMYYNERRGLLFKLVYFNLQYIFVQNNDQYCFGSNIALTIFE